MNGRAQPLGIPGALTARRAARQRPRAPPRARGPEFTARYPDGRKHVMYTANSTGTHDDPFDLGAVLVIDTAAASGPRRCDTSDGCTPTCASSCTSAS
jgi:FxLD family lantipeptide